MTDLQAPRRKAVAAAAHFEEAARNLREVARLSNNTGACVEAYMTSAARNAHKGAAQLEQLTATLDARKGDAPPPETAPSGR